MKYVRTDAKAYARENLRGIWAAALQPFGLDLSLDERGFRNNIRHWIDDLRIRGLFINGKQGEFFAMSLDERKRAFDIAVDEIGTSAGVILSCSDQNMDTVVELARYAEAIGADFVVVHAPVLHFLKAQDETLYAYYKYISERVNIGIAMWSHPDSGYLMSPELCARIAELPNIVAIKYSVPREMYVKLTQMAGDRIIVSTASEEEWLDNILELNWQCYLCSNPPYLFQTAGDLRMHAYTERAFAGDVRGARAIWQSLEPVRHAFKTSRPPEKPQAHAKCWQELLGQVGGAVRRPMLPLSEAERQVIVTAFAGSGLMPSRGNLAAKAASATA
jgi:4-hydroxy-tetrahydrodipicolinate synthase